MSSLNCGISRATRHSESRTWRLHVKLLGRDRKEEEEEAGKKASNPLAHAHARNCQTMKISDPLGKVYQHTMFRDRVCKQRGNEQQ